MLRKGKVLIILLILFILGGCGSPNTKSLNNDYFYQPDFNESNYGYQYTADNYNPEEKNIVTGETDIETDDLDKAQQEIVQLIDAYQALTKSSRESKYNYDNCRYSTITIYIPADKYNDFITELKKVGNMTSSSYNSDNITEEYNVTNNRLLSLQAQEEKVRELYARCTEIDELLQIEQRLSELESEITTIQNKINNYNLLTSYSTLTINLKEVSSYTKVESGFFHRLLNSLKYSFNNFLAVVEDIVLFISGNIFTISAIILLLLLFKKIAKKKNLREKLKARRDKS